MLRAILPWVTALLCLCLTLPLTAQSTSTGGGRDGGESENATDCVGTCSANAGGAINVCSGEPVQLNGSPPGVPNPMPQWTASPNNPHPTTIVDPNDLQTSVTATNGGPLLPGQYTFTLSITCTDGDTSCDDVIVNVSDIGTISIEPHEDVTCEQSFTFVGSVPNPGVTPSWSVSPSINASFEPNGNTFTITNSSSNIACTYTVIYRQTIGGCIKADTSTIEFLQSYYSLNLVALNDSCEFSATLRGDLPGCGGTPVWTYIDGPTPTNEIIITDVNERETDVIGTIRGDHTFSYTIENGECPTLVERITVFLDTCQVDSCRYPLEDFSAGFTCVPFEEIETYTFTGPDVGPEFALSWSVTDIPEGVGVEIIGSNTQNSVTIAITGSSPNPASQNFIELTLTSTWLQNELCVDTQLFYLVSTTPDIYPINDPVFLNCGGDEDFRPAGNLFSSGNFDEFIIDEAPEGFPASLVDIWMPLQSFTTVNLSVEGSYTFRATNQVFSTVSVLNPEGNCSDTTAFTVIVNDVPTINAGADQILCATSTQLNGSIPINSNSEPVDIPVFWQQISGPLVTFSATDIPGPVISGLQYGEVYQFRYSFPSDPTCIREDIVTITINPEEECCPLSIESECFAGCTTFKLEGADTYIADNENVDYLGEGRFQICHDEPVVITFSGIDENGQTCGSITQLAEPCDPEPETCNFRLTTGCDFCGCQEVKGIVRIIDEYGNVADGSLYDITWTIDGEPYDDDRGAISFFYDVPAVVEATLTFILPDGSLCEWTDAIYVSCLGECPEIEFRTCDDADFAEEEDCERGGGCSFGAYTGPVWVVDPAGDPINTSSFLVNWEIENGSVSGNNPYYLQTSNSVENCGSDVKAILTNLEGDCETEADFSYDCCSNAPVEIECHQLERGYELQWWGSCSTTAYQVTVVTYTGQVFTAIVPANNENIYPIPPGTPDAFYSVRAICASGELGPAHNCISISSAFGCSYFDRSCLDLIGIESTGSTGGGGRPKDGKSSVFPTPVKGGPLNLSLADELLGNAKPYLVTVYSALGKSLHHQVIEPYTKTVSIETQRIPKGLNYLIIRTPDGKAVETIKFIKQ